MTMDHYGESHADPTMHLRFMNGRLQQLWIVGQIGMPMAVCKREWRDVPDATPSTQEEPRDCTY